MIHSFRAEWLLVRTMPLPARYMQDSTKRSFALAAPAAADGDVSGMF
jgi:hypothetical protein